MRYWREIGMAVLAIALGSALAVALLESDQTVPEPERVAEIQYVMVPEPQIVYVDRIVEREVPQVIEVPVPVPVEVLVAVPTVQAVPVPPPAPAPPTPPPAPPTPPPAPPTPPPVIVEPPPVVPASVCEHRGKGQGHQHGVCRKQGFP